MELPLPVWAQIFIALSVVALLVHPVLLLAHELGHALVALRCSSEKVQVTVGWWPHRRLRADIGRLRLDLHPEPVTALTFFKPSSMLPRDWFALSLAGPAASLLAGLGLGAAAWHVGSGAGTWGWILVLSSAVALLQVIYSSIPAEARLSDGYAAMLAWRAGLGSREPMLHPNGSWFSPRYRQVIVIATAHAMAQNYATVGPLQMAHAILKHGNSPAARALAGAGVATSAIESAIRSEQRTAGELIVLTPAAEDAIERARRALAIHDDQLIDTEHILLGLLEDAELIETLRKLGVDTAALRGAALEALR